ncbi:MAG: hypothetical protein NWQ41_06775 [Saprospiraceae bacterium]|nr:hypothetical protein [Saprospiraceae bacterium]
MKRFSKIYYFAALAFFLIFFVACEFDRGYRDIRDFYFPMRELKEGLVYEYRSVNNDSLAPYYWFYRSMQTDSGMYLTGMNYGHDFIPTQFVQEAWVSNGMLLDTLFLYFTDTSGRQQPLEVEIEAGNLFSFSAGPESGVLLYRVKWQDPYQPGVWTTVIKNRQFVRDTTWIWEGKPIDAVVFHLKELFSIEEDGALEQTYDGMEIYARGLGLVYTKKVINTNFILEYELTDRYSMEILEEKFRRYQTQ